MRRYVWIGVALWLLVALGSAVGYVRTPPQYVATQGVDVALAPVGQVTSASQQRLDAQAASLAQVIASPGFLSSPPFATAVSQQFSVVQGPHAPTTLAPEQVAAALSATHTGARVTISAQALTSRQAELLAQAAVQTLAVHADELLSIPNTATMRVIPDQSLPHTIRDATADDAARNLLLARLALATTTAVLFIMALSWIGNRVSQW